MGSVVKPAVQNTYKRCRSRNCIWWHIPVHAIFAVFYPFFIPVLPRSSFTSRTPNKDQKTEQLFYFLLVQALLCMLLTSVHKSSNIASLYYINVIGLYVNVHSEITIFVLFLTWYNSGTAWWQNFDPVLHYRATHELLNVAWIMGIHPEEHKCPTFCTRHFCERFQVACTKALAAELMNVSGLWDLNKQKVEELLCLLVFVWSPRSERWLKVLGEDTPVELIEI